MLMLVMYCVKRIMVAKLKILSAHGEYFKEKIENSHLENNNFIVGLDASQNIGILLKESARMH